MEVTLIGCSQYFDGRGNIEALIERAGRICYQSEPRGKPGEFIARRVAEGHESIIEHASASFEVNGISRAASHQLVRHRIASYSQSSQRYIRLGSFPGEPAMETIERLFVIPPDIAASEQTKNAFIASMILALAYYEELIEAGIKKEDARFVLPNATKTSIVVTMNFRSWRHFIKERGLNPAAQWEIRELALIILEQLNFIAPSVFRDLITKRDSQMSLPGEKVT